MHGGVLLKSSWEESSHHGRPRIECWRVPVSIPSEWIFFIGVAALAFSLHVPLSSVILFWNQTRDTVIVIQFCVPSQRREEEILKKVWGTKLPPPLPVLLHRIVCLFSLSWSSRPSTDRHHSYLPIGTEWHFVLAYRILETYLANAQVIFSIAGFSAKWQHINVFKWRWLESFKLQ